MRNLWILLGLAFTMLLVYMFYRYLKHQGLSDFSQLEIEPRPELHKFVRYPGIRGGGDPDYFVLLNMIFGRYSDRDKKSSNRETPIMKFKPKITEFERKKGWRKISRYTDLIKNQKAKTEFLIERELRIENIKTYNWENVYRQLRYFILQPREYFGTIDFDEQDTPFVSSVYGGQDSALDKSPEENFIGVDAAETWDALIRPTMLMFHTHPYIRTGDSVYGISSAFPSLDDINFSITTVLKCGWLIAELIITNFGVVAFYPHPEVCKRIWSINSLKVREKMIEDFRLSVWHNLRDAYLKLPRDFFTWLETRAKPLGIVISVLYQSPFVYSNMSVYKNVQTPGEGIRPERSEDPKNGWDWQRIREPNYEELPNESKDR